MMKTGMTLRRVAALGMMAALASVASAQKATVGIMEFENKAGIDGRVASGLADMMMTALMQTRKFDIVERSQLAKVVDEQALGASGAVDPSTAARIGNLSGADYLLLGAVTEASAKASKFGIGGLRVGSSSVKLAIDVRFVDSETGNIMWADYMEDSKDAPSIDVGQYEFDLDSGPTQELARGLVDAITENIVVTVYPPIIIDYQQAAGTVIVNYGDVFFERGETYDVIRKGEPVKDPTTGEIVAHREEHLGRIKITEVEERASHGEVVDGTVELNAVVEAGDGGGSGGGSKKKGFGKFFRKKN